MIDGPEAFFAGEPLGLEVHRLISDVLSTFGAFSTRTTRSQVAFRRRKGFAFLWLPRLYLGARGAPLVLSVALGRRINSSRWKQVVQPAPSVWMHHLEIHDAADVDDEVCGWLREAFDAAGPRSRPSKS